MKSFRVYLAESVRTYSYKIKVAGECPKNWIEMFCMNLQKFDPVTIGKPRVTPIQKEPYGFPGLNNQSVTIIDVDFKYPATEPMIKQLARLLNYDENLVVMVDKKFDDSASVEAEKFENQQNDSPLLGKDYTEKDSKEASQDYADQYLTKIFKEKNSVTSEKNKAPDNKIDANTKSPMTSVNRPPMPATGSSKK